MLVVCTTCAAEIVLVKSLPKSSGRSIHGRARLTTRTQAPPTPGVFYGRHLSLRVWVTLYLGLAPIPRQAYRLPITQKFLFP